MSLRFFPVFAMALSLVLGLATSARPQDGPPSATPLGRSWDAAYLEDKPSFTLEPSTFLVDVVNGLKPGAALDVGMGQGRNALFLAKQGWTVTGFDVSRVGIEQARAQAQKAGLTLTTVLATDAEFDWGTNRWDLIVVAYFPQLRRSMARIVASLKPGGVVVVEAYHADAALDRSPGPGPGVTYQANELPTLVAPLRVLRYEEPRARADWGLYETRLVRLLAQKRP